MKNYLLVILFSLSINVFAQRYPVQSTMHISAPYSVFLSDYTNVGSQKLQLQLFLSDATVSDIDVKFRISIKGEGVEITTNPNFAPRSTIIEGGMMQRLHGEDLYEYFKVENLNLSGISRSQYLQGMALPDGLYTFSIDVLDYHTGRKLANTASSMGWLILNDTPLLNSPKTTETLRFLSPQNIMFQWTPRHTGSPNSAFTTSYNFELYEVWAEGRSPEETVRTSTPLFSTTVYSNNFMYGFAEPELLPGKQYAWRVQAVAEGNINEIELFKNHGYSEVYSFYWGQNCEAVNDVRANKLTHNQMQLEWDANDNHTKFKIEYRPVKSSKLKAESSKQETSSKLEAKSSKGANPQPATRNPQPEWYSQESIINQTSIRKLPSNTEFEVRVLPYCGSFEPEDALIYNFSTTEVPENNYNCGGEVEKIVITNRTEIEQLMVGDVVMAGDFPIDITEVTKAGSTYTGKGAVVMPLLGGGTLAVAFVNIKVNTDYQLIDGFFKAGSSLESNVGDGSWALKIDLNDKEDNHIVSDKDIIGIRIGPGGEVILIDSNGSEHNTDMDAKTDGGVKVTDKDGDIVVVTDGGGILASNVDTDVSEDSSKDSSKLEGESQSADKAGSKGGDSSDGDDKTSNEKPVTSYVEFSVNETQKYGFDTYSHSKIDKHYRTTKILDKTRKISWKSFTAGQTDNIVTNASNDSVKYTTILGDNYIADKGIININGPPAESVEELYAYVNTKNKKNEDVKLIVGQLNLVGYEQINRNLVIVRLNDGNNIVDKNKINQGEIQKRLDTIYAQASVKWTVEAIEELNIEDLELDINNLNASGSLLSTNYSSELRRIINKYKDANNTDDEQTYYLFIANSATDKDIQGYMRLQSQFGFIFTEGQTTKEINHTIAHELGHGAFYLKHPFSEHSLAETEKHNLMNYGGGTELWKYQWDWVHDPSSWAMNWMQGDEEGQKVFIGNDEKLISLLENIRCSYKTKSLFSYKKPLGFVDNILTFDNIKLSDNIVYDKISLYLKDDVDNYLANKVQSRKTGGEYYFDFDKFTIITYTETSSDNLQKYLFDVNEADWITQQARQLASLNNELNKSKKDEDKIVNILYSLSSCSYSFMTESTREKSLGIMSNQFFQPEWNEEIVINLIESVLDKPDEAKKLYDYFEENPKVFYGLYNGTDNLRSRFVELSTALCAINWTENLLLNIPANQYYTLDTQEILTRSSYDEDNGINIWSLWKENLALITKCARVSALAPIGIAVPCTVRSESEIKYLPAIFIQSLTDDNDKKSLEQLSNVVLTFAGGYGSINLITSGSKIGKIIGAIELFNLTADGIITNPLVRNELMQSDEGKKFLEYWPYIKSGIDLATVSTDVLTTFVKTSRKASKSLSKLSAEDSRIVTDRIDEIEDFLKRNGVDVADGGSDLTSLIAKWDNLTISEAKNLYSKLSKTDVLGSKTVVSQSDILAEINTSSSLVNPYNFSYSIDDIVLSQEALFVRVHNTGNPNRPWIIAIEDFQKFTSQDAMIKKLALPILDNTGSIVKPTQISIVKVPVGTKVRKSVARPQDWPGQGHLPGGAVQFEIRDQRAKIEWFKKIGNVNDYLN